QAVAAFTELAEAEDADHSRAVQRRPDRDIYNDRSTGRGDAEKDRGIKRTERDHDNVAMGERFHLRCTSCVWDIVGGGAGHSGLPLPSFRLFAVPPIWLG